MKLSLLAYGIFTDCTAITPGSVTAQVVKLEQPHAPGHVGEVLRDLALLHNIIDDIDSEHHAADDQLDLAGIGHRSGPADGIFGLDLGEPDGAELLLIVDKTITELQAGVEDPGAAGPKETAEDGLSPIGTHCDPWGIMPVRGNKTDAGVATLASVLL